MGVDELGLDRPRAIKIEGQSVVLFRLGPDEIHAIDNRCPHEGYPLSTGALKDGVLTCEWHNWKFRLCDGVCLVGGEDVRRYPLRIDDGGVWLDLTEPPAAEHVPALYRSLTEAFDEGDWGHAGRAVERLLAAGEAPRRIIGFGCAWAAEHAPYGFDHGMAAAADLVALVEDFADAPSIPVLEALSLLVEPNLRRPVRVMGEPVPVAAEAGAAEPVAAEAGAGWERVGRALRQRIEDEDVAGAEGILRGALAAGAGPGQVFSWLTGAATDHFLDFGHAHIYCVKAEELLAGIGWEHAHPVLTSLVTRIAYGTREDRLPYMRAYGREAGRHHAHLARWAQAAPDPAAAPDVDALLGTLLDGDLAAAMDAVAAALDRRVPPARVALVLGLAAAHRLLRFDARLEHRDDISEGWLHVTHALTHADAVRESLLRHAGADALRGLFQGARFVQHLAPCDAPVALRPALPAHGVASAGEPAGAPADALVQALGARDAAGAMAAMRLGLARGVSPAPMEAALRRHVATDSAVLPIFVAHHIKTSLAAMRLVHALRADPVLGSRDDADLPALAAVRFVAHPLRERRVARQARVARDFVTTGRRQDTLLGY